MKTYRIFLFLLCLTPGLLLKAQTRRTIEKQIPVVLGSVVDISSNERNAELELLMRSAITLGLSLNPRIEVTDNTPQSISYSKKELPKKETTSTPTNSVRIDIEFAVFDGEVYNYVRMSDGIAEHETVRIEEVGFTSDILAVADKSVKRIVQELRKFQEAPTDQFISIALLPAFISEKKSDYIHSYLRELVLKLTEDLGFNDNWKIRGWQEAESYYFTKSKGNQLVNEVGSPVIQFEYLGSGTRDRLAATLIRENERPLELFEWEPDENEEILIAENLNTLLNEIIGPNKQWRTGAVSFTSNRYQDYVDEAQRYYREDQYFFSNFMYDRALKIIPKNASGNQLANIHLFKGINYHLLTSSVQTAGNYTLGDIYLDLAMTSYRKAIEFDSTLVQPYAELGKLLLYDDQNAEALIFYEKAYELDPNWTNIKSELGSAYYWNYEYEKAIPLLEGAISENHNDDNARFFLGYSYQFSDQVERSIPQMEVLYAKESTNSQYQYGLGNAYVLLGTNHFDEGRFQEAIDQFKEAETYYDFEYLNDYYRQAYANIGDYEKAEEYLNKDVESGLTDETQIYYTHANDLLGIWLGMGVPEGDLADEIKKYAQKHIDISPEDPNSYSLLGMVHYNLGEDVEGLRYMEQGWNLDKTDFWAGVNLLESYVAQSQYDKAIDLYNFLADTEDKNGYYYTDEKIMMRFLAVLAKCASGANYRVEARYVDDYLDEGNQVESWYYNLIDDWMDTLVLDDRQMEVIEEYVFKMKEATIEQ